MEKAKNDFNPRRSLLKKIMIFLGIGIICVFGLALSFSLSLLFIEQQTRSGEFIEELSVELIPTAEYLLNHPLPTPVYLSIENPKSKLLEDQGDITEICIRTLDGSGLFGTSRFFVNGVRLPADLITRSFVSGIDIDPRYEEPGPDRSWACIGLPLKQGLHLIGFQPSVWEPRPIYQWAIEVK